MLSFLFGKPSPPPPATPYPQAEDIKGISNVTGRVRGHANGLINFGDAAPTRTRNSGQEKQQRSSRQEQAQANGNSAGGNVPAGTKKVRGLANVTGDVEGSGNGGVNFGQLTYNDKG